LVLWLAHPKCLFYPRHTAFLNPAGPSQTAAFQTRFPTPEWVLALLWATRKPSSDPICSALRGRVIGQLRRDFDLQECRRRTPRSIPQRTCLPMTTRPDRRLSLCSLRPRENTRQSETNRGHRTCVRADMLSRSLPGDRMVRHQSCEYSGISSANRPTYYLCFPRFMLPLFPPPETRRCLHRRYPVLPLLDTSQKKRKL
jgi:hypothetical protein